MLLCTSLGELLILQGRFMGTAGVVIGESREEGPQEEFLQPKSAEFLSQIGVLATLRSRRMEGKGRSQRRSW